MGEFKKPTTHRIAWIMQAARDFAQDGQTIVTQIAFVAVKEGEEQA